MTEKKIVISGIDNFSSTFNKLNQEQRKQYTALAQEAQKQGGAVKDQLAYLQKLIQKEQELEAIQRRRSQHALRAEEFLELSQTRNPRKREQIRQSYGKHRIDLAESSLTTNEGFSIFRELLQETKKQTKIAEQEEKARQEGIDELNNQWISKQSLWLQEIGEDERGVRKKIKKGGKNLTTEQREKLEYQSMTLQERDKKRSQTEQESMFQSLLKLAAVREVFTAFNRTAQSLATATNENAFVGSLLGSTIKASGSLAAAGTGALLNLIPGTSAGTAVTAGGVAVSSIVGDVAGSAESRHLEEQRRLNISRGNLRGMTGRDMLGEYSKYGFSKSEASDLARNVAGSYGSFSELRGEFRTRSMMSMMKGLSLDGGLLNQIAGQSRISGKDAETTVATVMSAMKRKGIIKGDDNSLLPELLTQQNQFYNEQRQRLEHPSLSSSAGILSTFRGVGGSFNSTDALQRVQSVNQALVNPGNDFQRARSFGVLNEIKPGASYFQLLKMRSKGLEQDGYLTKMLEQFERETGGDPENMALRVMNEFNYQPEQAEAMVSKYLKKRSYFTGMKSKEVKRIVGIENKVKANVDPTIVNEAKYKDAYAESPTKGLRTVLDSGIDKFVDELTTIVKEAFHLNTPQHQQKVDTLKEAIENGKYGGPKY